MLGIHAAFGSLKLIHKVTQDKIRSDIMSQTDYLVDGLMSRGFVIRSPRSKEIEKSGIISFVSRDDNTEELYHKLIKNNCYVAYRDDAIRLSPHFYNSKGEADIFFRLIR